VLTRDTTCIPIVDDDYAQYDCVSHRQQVRYSVRKIMLTKEWGERLTPAPFYYIFDNKKNDLPEWAECLFPLRTFAIGHLQKYIASVHPRTRYSLIKEWEESLITFTHRKKSELRYPF